jgi:hypothetical protein
MEQQAHSNSPDSTRLELCFLLCMDSKLGTHMKGRTMTVDVQGQGAQEIFEPKKEETRGGWRKLLNEEPHDLCNIYNTIKVMKTRRMRLVGYIACMGETKNTYMVLVVKPEPG